MTNIHDAASQQLLEEQRRVGGAPVQHHRHSSRPAHGATKEEAKRPEARKRKAEDDVEGHVDKKAFTLRPSPPSMYDRPSTFKPLHLLDRALLPLCYLDTAVSESKIAQQRFFSCDTELLGGGDKATPQLLIARLDVDKTLYAVEKVEKGTYAVCRLAHWVKPKDVKGEDAGSLPGRVPLHRVSGNVSRSKQDRLGKSKDTGMSSGTQIVQEPAAARDVGVESAIKVTAPPVLRPWQADEHDLAALDELAAETEHTSPAPTQRQMFEKLVCQYMETLYFSKTSLAFFAKGPLSRARAAFTASNGKMMTAELASFLRSLCIQSSSLDKKYREKLPEVLHDILKGALSDEEGFTKTPAKKKAPRRLHPTKGGMFPLEEDYVQRWWTADDDVAGRRHHGETAEALLRRRLNDVRLRETLLQVIVTLEALALEASPDYKPLEEPEEREILPSVEQNQERSLKESQPETKSRRAKKPQDLGLALDVLVDKLCIWQSIEQDEATTSTPKKTNGQPTSAANPARATNSDLLRDFYSEVIRPFYVSRLPQQVAMLGKKLGGPAASPPKQPAVRPGAAVVRRAPKPGEATAPAKQPRKSLHRIATDTAAAQKHAKTPSLVRFASESAMMTTMKRERSTTPALSSIPLASPTSTTHSRRGSIADFMRLNKRQIDLAALSASTDAKQKKKAAIDEQVRNAISTLRKPNRGAAVKEIVDFAETRRAVLVDATPKRVNKFAAITPHHVSRATGKGETVVPSSGAVPATGSRVRHVDATPARAGGARPQVTETPSRGGAWSMPFKDVPIDGRPHDIGMSATGSLPAIFATPSKPRTRVVEVPPCEEQGIFMTPLKSKEPPFTLAAAGRADPAPASAGNSVNIYSALGWDDDVDDLA